jgi:hypothetical protein
MEKPKRERRGKSVPTPEKHEPLEVEIRFTLSKPPPPPFIVTSKPPPPPKKADGPEPPPVIFRF